MTEEIKHLEGLLSQCIGPNKKVISSTVSRLTAPGENYLSLVLKVEATLLNEETGKEEQFSGVAKCLSPPMHFRPPRDENSIPTDGNNPSMTGPKPPIDGNNLPIDGKNPPNDEHEKFIEFGKDNYRSELVFYTEIIPTLQKFAKDMDLKRDVDIFPKLLAYRPNLHGKNDEVDMNSVLLLENMTEKGFVNMDRHVSFNYEDTLLILRDMALFHALPVALKLQMPNEFETKIRKHIERNPFAFLLKPKEGEKPKPPPFMQEFDVYCEILETYDHCKSYVSRLKRRTENFSKDLMERMDKPKREPFATISHNDCWLNNTMQIVEGDKVVKNKFVDFQTYSYDSPAQDLLFFIGTSVQLPVIKEHFAELLKYYYNNFIEVLQELGCETSAFSESEFEDELREEAFWKIFHVITFNKVVFGKKGQAIAMGGSLIKEDVNDIMGERAAYWVYICGKKGWI